MAYTYGKLRKVGVGASKQLKYEVFDAMGASVTLVSGTWKLLDKTNNEEVVPTATAGAASGTLVVNNADLNAAGATIKTVAAIANFTGVPAGYYWLFMNVVAAGYDAHLRAPIQVQQLDEEA